MHISREANIPEKIFTPDGEIIQEILGLAAGGTESHSLAKIIIPPGNASARHFHRRSEESYLILSGTANLAIDDQNFKLSEGEAVLIKPDEIHQITNQDDQDLVFLAVCVPAWHPGDSFEVEGDKE